MSVSNWKYIDNQFDVCTKTSKKRMNRISSDHTQKLFAESADPAILALYNRTLPLRNDFSDKYSGAISANALYKGKTSAFDAMKKELTSKKIKDWDVQIQNVFSKGTPEYIELLPRGRTPFQTGTNDQRIEEVKSLGERLEPHAALAATKADVDAFAANFKIARDTQQQNEESVTLKSDALESARIALANMMYGNLGVLMDKFKNNPKDIERFFDLTAIRKKNAETNLTKEGSVAGGDSLNVLKSGFDDNTEFLFANPGVTQIAFFTAPAADGVYTGEGAVLNPGESITKKANEIGASGNTFLNVTNLDPDNQGDYSVTIL